MFHISLLEKNTTKRKRVEKMPALDTSNDDNKKYKMEAIWDTSVYDIKSESDYLLGFFSLIV